MNKAERMLKKALDQRLQKNNVQLSEKDARTDGGEEYSIINGVTDKDGNILNNVVLLDSEIFKKEKNKEKALRQYIYDKLAGKQIAVRDKDGKQTVIEFARKNERVTKDGANNSRKVLDKLATKNDRNSRMAAAHAEEIVYVSRESEPHSNEHSHQWMDENGWDFRSAILLSQNGDLYEATLNIANARDGRRILYDINKIKSIGTATLPNTPNTAKGSRINPMLKYSISNPSEKVNNFQENSYTPVSDDSQSTANEEPCIQPYCTAQEIAAAEILINDAKNAGKRSTRRTAAAGATRRRRTTRHRYTQHRRRPSAAGARCARFRRG